MNNEIKSTKSPIPILVIIILIFLTITQAANILNYFNLSNIDKENGLNYNGNIRYNTSMKLPNISYKIPSDFTDKSSKYAINGIYEKYNDQGFLISCKLNVAFVANYEGAKDLASGIAKFNKTTYKLVRINNIDWYNVNHNSFFNTNIYLTTYKKQILMYEFKGTESCIKYNDGIINSISIR